MACIPVEGGPPQKLAESVIIGSQSVKYYAPGSIKARVCVCSMLLLLQPLSWVYERLPRKFAIATFTAVGSSTVEV